MPTHARYVPKHRDVSDHSALRNTVRNTLVASGVAAVATGISVSSGVLGANTGATNAVANDLGAARSSNALTVADLMSRDQSSSRSTGDRRATAERIKKQVLSDQAGAAQTKVEKINSQDPEALAKALMPEYGLRTSEFGCLDSIWSQESRWNVHADNPHSSAYGIPQALPGSKMASAGPDWVNSAETQIRWGLGYIQDRYGSACSAWGFKSGHGWY